MIDDSFLILNNSIKVEKDAKGLFIYKSNQDQVFKKDSTILKKKYHDLPRFKVILQYEENAKSNVDIFLKETTLDLIKQLKKF